MTTVTMMVWMMVLVMDLIMNTVKNTLDLDVTRTLVLLTI